MGKDINVKIKASDYASGVVDNVKSKADSVPNEKNVKFTATDEVSSTVDSIKGKLSGIGKESGNFFTGLVAGFVGGAAGQIVDQAMKSVGRAVGAAKEAFIDYNATMEQTQIAFESMLGSATEAKALMADLKTFAAKTPFEFEDIAPAAQQLKAFGFEAEQILPTLTAIGNASSGLGKGTEGLKQMAFVLGQIKTTGKLMGGDVMQLSQLGVPVKEILAKNLGLAADQMAEIGKLGIDADTAIQALITGMNDRFPDMMKKQSESFSGMMSTIRDNMNQIAGKIGEPIFNSVKDATKRVTGLFDEMLTNVNQKGLAGIFDGIIPDKLADNIHHLFDSIGQGWEALKGILGNVSDALGSILKPIWENSDFEMWLDLYDMIASGALNSGSVISAVVADIAEVIGKGLDFILGFYSEARTAFQEFYSGAFKGVVNFANKYLKVVWSWLSKALDSISEFVNAALDKLGFVGDAIRAIGSAVGKAINVATDWIKNTHTAKALSKPIFIDGSGDLAVNGGGGGGSFAQRKPVKKAGGGSGGAGSSGTGAASRAAQKIQNEYKKALDKIKEMAADIAEKIANITETKEQAAIRKLTKERVKYFNDIRKYQDAINAAQTAQEKAENEKKIEELTVQWKVYEAARKAEISREADKTGYELEMQHIQNLMDMHRISAAQQITMQNNVLEARRAQLEQLLNDETLNAEKRAAIEKQLAEVIKQAHQNAAYDMRSGWKLALEEIANQQSDFKQATLNIFRGIEDSMVNFMTSTDSMSKRLKNLFKDLATAIVKEISRIIARALVAQMATAFLGQFGGSKPKFYAGAGNPSKYLNIDPMAPFKASGGPVAGGRTYIVGERGPELFTASQNGYIHNNASTKAMLGGGQPKVNINVYNESGQPMKAEMETKLDGEEWVVNAWLRSYLANKGGLQDVVKGGTA